MGFMMVAQFGMSSVLGPMEYGRRYENLSSETRAIIEAEVREEVIREMEERMATMEKMYARRLMNEACVCIACRSIHADPA